MQSWSHSVETCLLAFSCINAHVVNVHICGQRTQPLPEISYHIPRTMHCWKSINPQIGTFPFFCAKFHLYLKIGVVRANFIFFFFFIFSYFVCTNCLFTPTLSLFRNLFCFIAANFIFNWKFYCFYLRQLYFYLSFCLFLFALTSSLFGNLLVFVFANFNLIWEFLFSAPTLFSF